VTGVELSPSGPGFVGRAGVYVADALKYWEPRRLVYNAVLAAVVLWHAWAGWPDVKSILSLNIFLGLFFFAVLANVCYCAVYLVDLFVQFSGLHDAWTKGRLAVLMVGTAFAAVITHFLISSALGNP
jgi:hypothetical protein